MGTRLASAPHSVFEHFAPDSRGKTVQAPVKKCGGQTLLLAFNFLSPLTADGSDAFPRGRTGCPPGSFRVPFGCEFASKLALIAGGLVVDPTPFCSFPNVFPE